MATRDVKCIFCKQEMFYYGDPEWEPEISIDYGIGNHSLGHHVYAHIKCSKEMLPLYEDEDPK